LTLTCLLSGYGPGLRSLAKTPHIGLVFDVTLCSFHTAQRLWWLHPDPLPCFLRRTSSKSGLTQFLFGTSSLVPTSSPRLSPLRSPSWLRALWRSSATALCIRHCEMTRQFKVFRCWGYKFRTLRSIFLAALPSYLSRLFPVTGSSLTSAACFGFCIRSATRHL
jgi:hypothetical protein